MLVPFRFAGLGKALPDTCMSNEQLACWFDTDDAWVTERTGIKQRYVSRPDETTAHLGALAASDALKDAGLTPDEIKLCLLGTETPDQQVPATAAILADEVGLQCGTLDLNAACASWVYGLIVAAPLVAAGPVLVVGSERMTSIIRPGDRTTAVLFGDGAGAAVLVPDADGTHGLLSYDTGSDPSAISILEISAGQPYVHMDGGEVFRRAVRVVIQSSRNALDAAGLSADDVDLFVPHQANQRIIDAACSRLGIPAERTVSNVASYGNTSAASIPIALAEAHEQGRLHDGDTVLVCGFGAGMTWASAVIRWGAAA